MKYFLDEIAGSLFSEFGNNLNRHCLVFPNRRAGLFFLKYLSAKIDKPVWQPEILTINELFRMHSRHQTAGNEMLLFELYKIYNRFKKPAESFDNFIYWGDILLNDFDDIDKYLVDASKLFRNISDLKNIEKEFESLDERQKTLIKSFWINFNPDRPTEQKDDFISIWSVLHDIYSGFRKVLSEKNLAYEGMIFREVAENENEFCSAGKRWDLMHFIGFNALNECERRVMLRLKNKQMVRFYWDYDESYLNIKGYNSAGFFLRENVRIFGNDMPESWNYKTLLSDVKRKANRKLIDTSSDISQVKLVPGLLSELPEINNENAHETAVILADENLLLPMLHTIPEATVDVNITMGFPLSHTKVYSLVKKLMDLQEFSSFSSGVNCFKLDNVLSLLRDNLIADLLIPKSESLIKELSGLNIPDVPENLLMSDDNTKVLFSRIVNSSELSAYFRNSLTLVAAAGNKIDESETSSDIYDKITNEFIYRAVLVINRLESTIIGGDVSFTLKTYITILDRMLRKQSVPFAGEPLSGIQIMGILETRALDFRNVILLSVNEGIIPAVSSSSSSYIPFSLREAFGLPSINHQESVYAYHFYRLLQQAENVFLVYNSNTDGLRSGEVSRFITQMMYDPELKPSVSKVDAEVKSQSDVSEVVVRKKEHREILVNNFSSESGNKLLSPTAINMWLHCRMKFFYRYINGLREPDELKTEIDAALLGEILHEVMFRIYSGKEGLIIDKDFINSLINANQKLKDMIATTLSKKLHHRENEPVQGNEIIIGDVINTYLLRILKADLEYAPFSIVDLEKSEMFNIGVVSAGKEINVRVGGVIDRIDISGGLVRVVDYKTGAVSDSVRSIEDLFAENRKKDDDGWLQTLLYCEALVRTRSYTNIRPSVFKIKKSGEGILSDKLMLKADRKTSLPIENYYDIRNDFLACLTDTLQLIFSENEQFIMTDDINRKCRFCCYRKLCMRH